VGEEGNHPRAEGGKGPVRGRKDMVFPTEEKTIVSWGEETSKRSNHGTRPALTKRERRGCGKVKELLWGKTAPDNPSGS